MSEVLAVIARLPGNVIVHFIRCANCRREYETRAGAAIIRRQKWCAECCPRSELGRKGLDMANGGAGQHRWTREEAARYARRGQLGLKAQKLGLKLDWSKIDERSLAERALRARGSWRD
jgi:hypothetical protein